MSQITLPLYADYQNRKLVTAEGSTYTPPTLTAGDTLLVPLRIMEKQSGSTELVEGTYSVRSIRASIGKTMDPPTAGGWNLDLEDPDHGGSFWSSASLALDIAAGDLTNAIQTLFTHIGVTIADLSMPAPCCWTFSTNADQFYNLQGGQLNTLLPVSFVRVRPFQQATKWWYEVRLIQSPLAFNEDGFERVLPDPPSITEIQRGAPATAETPAQNELQDLYIPPDFRGTYFFRFDFHRSVNISYADGQDVAAAALNGMYGDSTQRFNVTTPEDNHGQIEFMGPLGGAPQDEIDVEVYSHPPGVITFAIPLTRAELATALRTVDTLTLPLEIEIEIVDNPEDIDNMAVAGRIYTLCQVPVTVAREGIWKELAVVRKIDWQRPTSPATYLPFNESQLIPGQQHYPFVIGDGEATEITVDHNLGTKLLAGPPLVAESTGGKILTQNEDYRVDIVSETSVKFTFATPPALNAIFGVITTAGPVSTFIADLLIAIANVDGLQDLIDALMNRLSLLEALVPTGALGLSAGSGTAIEFEVPDRFVVFPNQRLGDDFDASTLNGQVTAQILADLPRPPALLPALHDWAVTYFNTGVLPASPATGVYKNTGTTAVKVPGGLGRRGNLLLPNEYAGYDGRVWYHLTRGSGMSESFFPSDFEQLGCNEFTFEPDTWRPGQVFSLEFDLSVALFLANSDTQWVLVIEHGTTKSDADTSATAIDITTAGTGTQRLFYDGVAVGTFAADAAANTITIANHALSNGDIVQVQNSGGTLPAPLAAHTDYVVRDVTTNTFKLAPMLETLSLRDVVWNPRPILTQRLTVTQLKQKRHFGCRIVRGIDSAITGDQLKAGAWTVADCVPRTPRFAIRPRLVRFDTENGVGNPAGYAFAAFTGFSAQIQ